MIFASIFGAAGVAIILYVAFGAHGVKCDCERGEKCGEC